MKDRSFRVFQRAVSSSGEAFTNTIWDVRGSKLQILRNRTQSKDGSPLTISFNNQTEHQFNAFEGAIFNVNFTRLILNAAELIGSGSLDDLVLIAFSDENSIFEEQFSRVNRYDAFAASTNQIIQGNVEGLYIKTFGNVQLMGIDGNTEILTGVLPGSFIPCSPSYIVGAGTTATGIIVYAK